MIFQKAAGSNRYSVSIGGTTKAITYNGTTIHEGIYPEWRTLSAATINGSNTVLWFNPTSNKIITWITDQNWNWSATGAFLDPNSNDGYTLETQFNLDLNNDTTIGAPTTPIENLRSRIVASNALANANKGFTDSITGTSGADNLTASKSDQLITGYDLITGIGTQPGQIDSLDGGNYFGKTYLLTSPSGQPYSNDGDQGFALIKNFRLGSDDLVLDKNQSYVFASRQFQIGGNSISGLGIHVDSNKNGTYENSDNLIGLLAYGDPNSAYGGNIAPGSSGFTGRSIFI